MKNKYLIVQISAEDKKQADNILNPLLEQKLVTGGQFFIAPAKFLWKGEVVEMEYCMITSYTVAKNRGSIIEQVKKLTVEEVPMITFVPLDGNKELLEWIDKTLNN